MVATLYKQLLIYPDIGSIFKHYLAPVPRICHFCEHVVEIALYQTLDPEETDSDLSKYFMIKNNLKGKILLLSVSAICCIVFSKKIMAMLQMKSDKYLYPVCFLFVLTLTRPYFRDSRYNRPKMFIVGCLITGNKARYYVIFDTLETIIMASKRKTVINFSY